MRRPLRAALAGLAATAAAAGLAVTGAGTAHAAPTPLPAHVYAPYFETYNTAQGPADAAAASGAKYLTMAFLQTDAPGSCTPYWDGSTGSPVASSSFGTDISRIQAAGGDVIPSFGGYSADDGGTEIADSCTDVSKIAAAYEKVVTTYGITRIDLDTEDHSLTDTAGIDRRNKAIKQVEDWAAASGRTVQFSYTLPTTTSGLAPSGLAVLQNAVSNNARVDVVNIMTFDYYDNASHEMATDTENAAQGLVGQLAALYPSKTAAQLWSMVGVTEMPGVDDFGPAETFTTADGPTVENWAASKGIASISMWALQRDNGGCPGSPAGDTCSSISQSTWQFSHDFEPFTDSTGGSGGTGGTGGSGVLVNGDLEGGSLSPWTCQSGGGLVSSPVHSGSHALAAAATDTQTGECDQAVALKPDTAYTLTGWVHGNYAYLGVSGGATASTWASGSGWTQLTVPFTTGASGDVTVYVHGWYAQGTVYADDLTLS